MFEITQKRLADRLGVPAAELAHLREQHLTRGTDYEKNGRELCYTAAAAERLAALFNIDALPLQPDPSAQKAPPEPITLVCWRAKNQGIVNPHIIVCYRPGANPHDPRSQLRVRVRDNANFMPGMEVPARWIEADLYECTRAAAPRMKGRW